jgi:hypothetical protein
MQEMEEKFRKEMEAQLQRELEEELEANLIEQELKARAAAEAMELQRRLEE